LLLSNDHHAFRFVSCTAPEGALAPWGGPAALKVFAPTFGFASLPPEGALAPWGGPAALKFS